MSYNNDFNNAQNQILLQQIQEALCSAALDVQAESTATASHAARSAFAQLVLASPMNYAAVMAYGICADGAVTPSSTDAQIKTRVSAVWNAFCVQS